jgi:hypothetical protein
MEIIKRKMKDYNTINPKKFWSKVDMNGKCWEWKAGCNSTGYGLYSLKSPDWLYERTGSTYTQLLAHRVAYWLYGGNVDGDSDKTNYIIHSCDNRKCCNPSHMRLGSAFENVQDMILKHRGFWQKR